MAAKRGLNKGLDALIPINNINEEPAQKAQETFINIGLIDNNVLQPRKKFDEDALAELAESIKQYGIIQPIVVQKKGDRYEIIAGERRWRAARLAKLKEVPVIIKDYAEEEIFKIALIENIQRQDLNPIEEAKAYKRLIEESSLTQDEVAEKVAKSRVAVTNSLRLLNLSDKVQEMVLEELISGGHARALLSIQDPAKQYEVANKVLDEKLSVRETEKLVKSIVSPTTRNSSKSRTIQNEAIYKEYENKMISLTGQKVEIQRKDANKGKIVIEFNSAEEFDKVYSILSKGGKQ